MCSYHAAGLCYVLEYRPSYFFKTWKFFEIAFSAVIDQYVHRYIYICVSST